MSDMTDKQTALLAAGSMMGGYLADGFMPDEATLKERFTQFYIMALRVLAEDGYKVIYDNKIAAQRDGIDDGVAFNFFLHITIRHNPVRDIYHVKAAFRDPRQAGCIGILSDYEKPASEFDEAHAVSTAIARFMNPEFATLLHGFDC